MKAADETEEELAIHPIVRQIIDRDCHVASANRQVIRHVISRLRDGYATYRKMSRDDRRALMRQCIACHKVNRDLYRAVMYPDYSHSRTEDNDEATA